jgi:hypothetical protein
MDLFSGFCGRGGAVAVLDAGVDRGVEDGEIELAVELVIDLVIGGVVKEESGVYLSLGSCSFSCSVDAKTQRAWFERRGEGLSLGDSGVATLQVFMVGETVMLSWTLDLIRDCKTTGRQSCRLPHGDERGKPTQLAVDVFLVTSPSSSSSSSALRFLELKWWEVRGTTPMQYFCRLGSGLRRGTYNQQRHHQVLTQPSTSPATHTLPSRDSQANQHQTSRKTHHEKTKLPRQLTDNSQTTHRQLTDNSQTTHRQFTTFKSRPGREREREGESNNQVTLPQRTLG